MMKKFFKRLGVVFAIFLAISAILLFQNVRKQEQNAIWPWVYHEDVNMRTGDRFGMARISADKTEGSDEDGRLFVGCQQNTMTLRFGFNIPNVERLGTRISYRVNGDTPVELVGENTTPNTVIVSQGNEAFEAFYAALTNSGDLYVSFPDSSEDAALFFNIKRFTNISRRLNERCR